MGQQIVDRVAVQYSLTFGEEMDDEFFNSLRAKLRGYNRRSAPEMAPPHALPINIQVHDTEGNLVGGVAALTYWGWLVIKMLVLDDKLRGNGIGQRLIDEVHQCAIERGCTSAQTMTYDFQALRFYQKQGYRIVGTLEDYPEGHDYYWLRKDFVARKDVDRDGVDVDSKKDA